MTVMECRFKDDNSLKNKSILIDLAITNSRGDTLDSSARRSNDTIGEVATA